METVIKLITLEPMTSEDTTAIDIEASVVRRGPPPKPASALVESGAIAPKIKRSLLERAYHLSDFEDWELLGRVMIARAQLVRLASICYHLQRLSGGEHFRLNASALSRLTGWKLTQIREDVAWLLTQGIMEEVFRDRTNTGAGCITNIWYRLRTREST